MTIAPTADRTGARILIVDDEPSVARALQRTLRNHEVTIVLSGREALELLDTRPTFDLIFCDLMMSEVSGMDLFEAVLSSHPETAARFVFMTGGAFTERAKQFVGTVDNPLIEKPFDIKHVQALVDGWCASEGASEPQVATG